MRTTAPKPATTPIPVQLSATEVTALIVPHLTMPKRGPKCTLGYHRLCNLILWGLYAGLQWQGLPLPQDATGKPDLHSTNGYRALATWSAAGSLQQAFPARVAHLSAEQQRDRRVLHGDGTNTVAQKGAMAWGRLATNSSRASR